MCPACAHRTGRELRTLVLLVVMGIAVMFIPLAMSVQPIESVVGEDSYGVFCPPNTKRAVEVLRGEVGGDVVHIVCRDGAAVIVDAWLPLN